MFGWLNPWKKLREAAAAKANEKQRLEREAAERVQRFEAESLARRRAYYDKHIAGLRLVSARDKEARKTASTYSPGQAASTTRQSDSDLLTTQELLQNIADSSRHDSTSSSSTGYSVSDSSSSCSSDSGSSSSSDSGSSCGGSDW